MPCDTVTTIDVALGKLDPGTFMRALMADGMVAVVQTGDVITWSAKDYRASYQYHTKTGNLEVTTGRTGRNAATADIAANLKQSFSRQLVRDQAKRYGWQLKEQGNKFTVIKRTL